RRRAPRLGIHRRRLRHPDHLPGQVEQRATRVDPVARGGAGAAAMPGARVAVAAPPADATAVAGALGVLLASVGAGAPELVPALGDEVWSAPQAVAASSRASTRLNGPG